MPDAPENLVVYLGRVFSPFESQAPQTSREGVVVARDMQSVLELEERLRQVNTCFLYEKDGRAVWPEMTLTCAGRLGPELEGEKRMPKTVEMIKGLRKFGMRTIPTGVIIGLAEARSAIVSLVHGDDAAPGEFEFKVDIQGEIRQVPITWGPGFLRFPLLSMKAYLSAYTLMENAREGIVGVRDPHVVPMPSDILVRVKEEITPMDIGVDLV